MGGWGRRDLSNLFVWISSLTVELFTSRWLRDTLWKLLWVFIFSAFNYLNSRKEKELACEFPIYNALTDCTFLCLRRMQLYLDVDSTDNKALWISGSLAKQSLDIFNSHFCCQSGPHILKSHCHENTQLHKKLMCIKQSSLWWLFSSSTGEKRSLSEMEEGKVNLENNCSPYYLIRLIYSPENFDKLVNLSKYNILNNRDLLFQALQNAVERKISCTTWNLPSHSGAGYA